MSVWIVCLIVEIFVKKRQNEKKGVLLKTMIVYTENSFCFLIISMVLSNGDF